MSGAEERLLSLLQQIAMTVRPCRLCGRTLYIVRLRSGDAAYLDEHAVNHFTNCPKRQASQERLFDPPAEAALDPQ